jgi:hypothetical protein
LCKPRVLPNGLYSRTCPVRVDSSWEQDAKRRQHPMHIILVLVQDGMHWMLSVLHNLMRVKDSLSLRFLL